MSTVRMCDRCGVVPALALDDSSARTLIVQQGDPSSNAVQADFNLTIGVVSTQDLCKPCLKAALKRYAGAL